MSSNPGEMIQRLGREDDFVCHPDLKRFFRAARTWAAVNPRDGSRSIALAAGTACSRSQVSRALSRSVSTRNPSRKTSLSLAYWPEATLRRTSLAIRCGSVMLNCWVDLTNGLIE